MRFSIEPVDEVLKNSEVHMDRIDIHVCFAVAAATTSADIDLPIKSLEEIRREQALASLRRNGKFILQQKY